MSELAIIAGVLVALLLPTLQKLIGMEVEGWLPRLSERLTRAAAMRLPLAHRDRYLDEWLAELASYSDRPVTRLIWAADLHRGSIALRRQIRARARRTNAEPRYGRTAMLARRGADRLGWAAAVPLAAAAQMALPSALPVLLTCSGVLYTARAMLRVRLGYRPTRESRHLNRLARCDVALGGAWILLGAASSVLPPPVLIGIGTVSLMSGAIALAEAQAAAIARSDARSAIGHALALELREVDEGKPTGFPVSETTIRWDFGPSRTFSPLLRLLAFALAVVTLSVILTALSTIFSLVGDHRPDSWPNHRARDTPTVRVHGPASGASHSRPHRSRVRVAARAAP